MSSVVSLAVEVVTNVSVANASLRWKILFSYVTGGHGSQVSDAVRVYCTRDSSVVFGEENNCDLEIWPDTLVFNEQNMCVEYCIRCFIGWVSYPKYKQLY